MLNKKGFSLPGDWMEFLLAIALIIFGFIIFSFLSSSYGQFSKTAKTMTMETDGKTIDTTFIATELFTILTLDIGSGTSFAELLSYTPRNYPVVQDDWLFNGYLEHHALSNRISCSDEVKEKLVEILSPALGNNWFISVSSENGERVFFCTPLYIGWFPEGEKITLPTQTPGETMDVRLEVYT